MNVSLPEKTRIIVMNDRPIGERVLNMINFLRNMLKKYPGRESLKYLRKKYKLRKYKNSEAIFTDHYKNNLWGNLESRSGPGSTLEYTANVRKQLPSLIHELNIKTILDAPCGDYNWFRKVQRDNVKYIGADIVKQMIYDNQEKHGNSITSFIHLDITKDKIPNADLWLCRDILIHLSNEDIFLVLENFLNSNVSYFLVSNYPGVTKNTDVPTGSGRHVNLELPPFNLCKPLYAIDDWIEGHAIRTLCLWNREQLSKII